MSGTISSGRKVGPDVIHTQRGIGYSLRMPRAAEGNNGAGV